MLATTRNPNLILSALLATLASVALLLGLGAPPAAATATTKDSVISISLGKKGAAFRAKGVRLRATSSARIVRGDLRLKATDITINSETSAAVVLRGGLTLKRGRRTLKIQGLMIRARGKTISITGKVGKKRLTVLSGRSGVSVVQGVTQQVVAPAVRAKLSTKVARLMRAKLKLRRTPSVKLGQLVVIAKADLPKPGGKGDATLQDLAGPPIARPAGAVDATASSLKWWMRDSWANYIEFSIPQDGAVPDAAMPNSSHVCKDIPAVSKSRQYAINFVFASGWWDAGTQTGYFRYSGALRWYGPEHGIDITASNPEIEINGAASRLIFTMYDAVENTLKRGAFVGLNTAAPLNSVALTPSGAASRLKSTIFTDSATSPFGNFVSIYSENPGWGCVDFGFAA